MLHSRSRSGQHPLLACCAQSLSLDVRIAKLHQLLTTRFSACVHCLLDHRFLLCHDLDKVHALKWPTAPLERPAVS